MAGYPEPGLRPCGSQTSFLPLGQSLQLTTLRPQPRVDQMPRAPDNLSLAGTQLLSWHHMKSGSQMMPASWL